MRVFMGQLVNGFQVSIAEHLVEVVPKVFFDVLEKPFLSRSQTVVFAVAQVVLGLVDTLNFD